MDEMEASARTLGDPIAEQIRAGAHVEATAACARVHGAALGRLCMALLGNQAEAEETAQDVLLLAHDAMPAYRGDGSVRAWLFTIARRRCARVLETRGRRERRRHLVPEGAAPLGPDGALQARRRAAQVREALDHLKPTERDAVVLRYQAGLSYREIGEACEVEEAAARKRVSRALARLRALLSEVDR